MALLHIIPNIIEGDMDLFEGEMRNGKKTLKWHSIPLLEKNS